MEMLHGTREAPNPNNYALHLDWHRHRCIHGSYIETEMEECLLVVHHPGYFECPPDRITCLHHWPDCRARHRRCRHVVRWCPGSASACTCARLRDLVDTKRSPPI